MNVPFTLGGGAELEKSSSQSEPCGPQVPQGHRSMGGARASIYNAMPMEGVGRSSTSWLSSRRTTDDALVLGGGRRSSGPPLRLCCPCIYSMRMIRPRGSRAGPRPAPRIVHAAGFRYRRHHGDRRASSRPPSQRPRIQRGGSAAWTVDLPPPTRAPRSPPRRTARRPPVARRSRRTARESDGSFPSRAPPSTRIPAAPRTQNRERIESPPKTPPTASAGRSVRTRALEARIVFVRPGAETRVRRRRRRRRRRGTVASRGRSSRAMWPRTLDVSSVQCSIRPVERARGEARVQFAHAFGAQGIVEPPCGVYRAREDEHAAGGGVQTMGHERGSDSAHEAAPRPMRRRRQRWSSGGSARISAATHCATHSTALSTVMLTLTRVVCPRRRNPRTRR